MQTGLTIEEFQRGADNLAQAMRRHKIPVQGFDEFMREAAEYQPAPRRRSLGERFDILMCSIGRRVSTFFARIMG